MKYFFLILISILLLSCNENNENVVTISKAEYDNLTSISRKGYPKPYHFMEGSYAEDRRKWQIVLSEDNHEFIENDGWDSYTIFHSPECIFCKKTQLENPKDTVK